MRCDVHLVHLMSHGSISFCPSNFNGCIISYSKHLWLFYFQKDDNCGTAPTPGNLLTLELCASPAVFSSCLSIRNFRQSLSTLSCLSSLCSGLGALLEKLIHLLGGVCSKFTPTTSGSLAQPQNSRFPGQLCSSVSTASL